MAEYLSGVRAAVCFGSQDGKKQTSKQVVTHRIQRKTRGEKERSIVTAQILSLMTVPCSMNLLFDLAQIYQKKKVKKTILERTNHEKADCTDDCVVADVQWLYPACQ